MSHTVRAALDHAVVLVADLAAAAAGFEAAGFTVTPEARHSPEMGTANRCVMLATTYVELLAVVAPTERNAGWRELLAGGPGLKGLAFRSGDIQATARRLLEHGVEAGPPLRFGRAVEGGTLGFSIVRVDRAGSPGLQMFACQHHTPGLLWTPDAVRHPNGARELSGLTAPCPDPAAAATVADAIDSGEGSQTVIGFSAEGGAGRISIRTKGNALSADLSASCGILLELAPA